MNKETTLILSAASLLAVSPAFAQGSIPTLSPPAPSATPQATPASARISPAPQVVVATLQDVCLPVLRGVALAPAAMSSGFAERDGQWTLETADKSQVVLEPPDLANPHVCAATIALAPGDVGPIGPSVAAWATAQSPPLRPVKSDVVAASGAFRRITWSWSGRTAAGVEGVVLSRDEPSSGQPGGGGQATLFVSLTPA
jgi:hypothetical protein